MGLGAAGQEFWDQLLFELRGAPAVDMGVGFAFCPLERHVFPGSLSPRPQVTALPSRY